MPENTGAREFSILAGADNTKLDAQPSTPAAPPASEPVHDEPGVTVAPPKRPRIGPFELALPTPDPGTPSPAAPPVSSYYMPRTGLVDVWSSLDEDEFEVTGRIAEPPPRYSIRVRGHAADKRPLTLWIAVGEGCGTKTVIGLLRRAIAVLERRIAPRRRRRVRGAR